MSNVISSYESVLSLIKKYYNKNLPLYYVGAEYNPILLNVLGNLLSMPKFAYVDSLELLQEPVVVHKTDNNVLVFLSKPFLAHYFNQAIVLTDDPIEFIKNVDPIQNLMSISIKPTTKYGDSAVSTTAVYNTKTNQLFNQFTTSNQRYVTIQMMRIILLAVHVQQHYLNSQITDITNHMHFRKIEMAKRNNDKRDSQNTHYSFYDSSDDTDDDNIINY